MPPVVRLAGWKYKEGLTDEQKIAGRDGLLKLYADLAHLVNRQPSGGKNRSKMGLHKGLDFAFTVEFKSEEARDEFNVHPTHAKLGAELGDLLGDIFIFDAVKDDWSL